MYQSDFHSNHEVQIRGPRFAVFGDVTSCGLISCTNVLQGKFYLCLRVEQMSRHSGPYTDDEGGRFIRKMVECTLVQLLRLCTGRTAHRGSKGIALFIHDQRH